MEFNFSEISDTIVAYAPRVAGALLTLIIGFWVIGWITRLLKRTLEKRQVDETIRPFLASLVNVLLKVLLLVSVAGMFGVETTSFVAMFGAFAFAIGLALQGNLGHLASGILLLAFKPYKVGDLVELEGKVGTVEAIQIFNTIILTPDNKKVIIPNGVVTSGVIINISGQGKIRVDMTYGIGYDDDIDKAREVIQKVSDSCPQVLKDIPTDIFVSEHADSSVNFAVRPWCKSEHYWDVYFYMHENIKKAFDKAGVGIPFPQVDVHMKGDT
jgi:small conductance mechanosensitive channel